MMNQEQIPVRCTLMRGGTSKGVFLRECDVPPPGPARDRFLLALLGSPDFSRTVRRLMEGTAYVRRAAIDVGTAVR